MVPLPGEAKAGRDLAVMFPGVANRLAFLWLAKGATPLRILGLQIFNLGNPSTTANPLNPDFHS